MGSADSNSQGMDIACFGLIAAAVSRGFGARLHMLDLASIIDVKRVGHNYRMAMEVL